MEENNLEGYRTDPIPDQAVSKKGRSRVVRFIIDVAETLILSILLFVGINAISARIRVDGHSMEPTLQSGEFVIVNKLAYKFGTPESGDVIVFHYPRDPNQEYIKRIIGLPGDEVKISNGTVYLNEQPIQEPYIAAPPNYQSDWDVPTNSLFVLGDNRNNSSDSHNWGPVPMEYVIGKALVVYWPPEKWGLIQLPSSAKAAP
ncbi:MAG: signal peptidase I [Anaerolineales bacterium]|jgi:signal peptidase I